MYVNPVRVVGAVRRAVLIALMAWPLAAAAQNSGTQPVEAIQTEDGRVIYKYVDADGQVTFQDRPPPEYFENLPQDDADTQAQVEVRQEPVAQPAAPAPRKLPAVLFVAAGLLLIAAVYVLKAPALRRLRAESRFDRFFRKAGMDSFANIQLNVGPRSQIEIDRLVKTPAGILVIGEERLSGSITGIANSDVWSMVSGKKSIEIVNPLQRVERAAGIVQEVVGPVPVFPRVLYIGQARFVNGTPATVRSLASFRQGLDYFSKDKVDARALDAGWRGLMRFPRSNTVRPAVFGEGWEGWIRRNWRQTCAGVSTGLAMVVFLTAIFFLLEAASP